MKTLLLVSFFISIVYVAEAQNIFGCYTYRSSYYEGDFKKICLREDYTFTYIFHQNDVIGDYISGGNWWRQNDSIYFKSIEKPNVVQYGNPVNQKVNIQLKDNSNDKFPYAYARCFNENKLTTAIKFDTLGFASVDLTNATLISINSLYTPYNISVSDIKQENIVVIFPINRFRDISSLKLFYDSMTKTLIEVKNKRAIYYPLDLSDK